MPRSAGFFMLPPVRSDNLRQSKYPKCIYSDVLRIDSFYFYCRHGQGGLARWWGSGHPRRQKPWTLASVLWNRDDHGGPPDIRPPSVGADGTDSRFTLDKTVEWKVIV